MNLTIITPHYKDLTNLSKTYKSLSSQTYSDWTLLIIDSYTQDFHEKVLPEILNDNRVKIIQQKSSIYDAHNLGILLVDTQYFHILNAGTTYPEKFTLSTAMNSVKHSHDNFGLMLHLFALKVVGGKRTIIQKPSKSLHPFNSAHEAIIYPNKKRDRILHDQKLGVVADSALMFDYSLIYPLKVHPHVLTIYPRGGDSDVRPLFFEKIKGYSILFIRTFLNNKPLASLFALKQIVRDIIIKIMNLKKK